MADKKKPILQVVTTTTTTTTVPQEPTCLLWTSFILGILIVGGSIVPLNVPLIVVGLLSATSSGLFIFACSPTVKVVAFWMLFSVMVIEALAAITLIGVGIALMVNPNFLGFGIFFGIISFFLAVPVITITVIDLVTVLRIRPIVFDTSPVVKKTVEEKVESGEAGKDAGDEATSGGDEAGDDATEESEIAARRAQKLPLLAMKP